MKKGISIIVLVITVIVMIIVAGAIIITLTRTNIINQATQGKNTWDASVVKEEINTLIASNYKTITINGELLKKTNMTDMIGILQAKYGKENITIRATSIDPDNTSTESDLIAMGLVYEYKVKLWEELEKYVKTLPGRDITIQELDEYFKSRATVYEEKLAALGYTQDNNMPAFRKATRMLHGDVDVGDPVGYGDATLQKMLLGNVEEIISWKNFAEAITYMIKLTVVIDCDGQKVSISQDGTIKNGEYIPPTRYTINRDGEITGCIGDVPIDMIIPNEINGTEVTGIVEDAFAGNTTIKSLIIENNSSFTVRERAFDGCTNLEDISFTADMCRIKQYSFRNCTKLKNIYLYIKTTPDLAQGLFSGCTGNIIVSGRRDPNYNEYSNEILEQLIRQLLSEANEVTVNWLTD